MSYVKTYAIPAYFKCLLEAVPEYKGYKLSISKSNEGNYFIVWENPQENEKWRNSVYGEYYEPGDDASFAVLGIDGDTGEIYLLTSEDKYYRSLDGDYLVPNKESNYLRGIAPFLNIKGIGPDRVAKTLIDEGTLDPKGYLKELLRSSFHESVWEMED